MPNLGRELLEMTAGMGDCRPYLMINQAEGCRLGLGRIQAVPLTQGRVTLLRVLLKARKPSS